jgi:hypothetical protein
MHPVQQASHLAETEATILQNRRHQSHQHPKSKILFQKPQNKKLRFCYFISSRLQ